MSSPPTKASDAPSAPSSRDDGPADPPGHRSGFVAICGRPNVGKSTLLNALLGETVAVATRHPQTTRQRLLGIWTDPAFQVVLVDTPGLHRARSALNRFMVEEAKRGARDVDLILLLAEAPALTGPEQARQWSPGPVAVEGLEALVAAGRPIILVLTKIDRLSDPDLLLPVLDKWHGLHRFEAAIGVSALHDEGLDALRHEVLQRLPIGPRYYDDDQLSDRNLRWHAAELIRAELFEHLREELPYSCAVVVDAYKEQGDRDVVRATIYTERDSQKGMVIGRGASVIKAISMGARGRIARLSGRPCELHLQVGVAKGWTKDPKALQRLGYHDPGGS